LKRLDEGRFDLAWGGISSLEIGLPVVWTEASRRGFDLADVVQWMSAAPARLVNVATGITPGAPANLVVFDPDAVWTVRGAQLHHRWPVTPYEGYELRGAVRRTYVRGRLARSGGGMAL
jgi:allantoinase